MERRSNYQPPCRAAQHTHSGARLPRHLWSGGATTNRRVVRHSIHIQAFAYPAIYGAEEQLPTAVSCGTAYTLRRSLSPPSMERRSNYQPPCRAAQHTHSGVRLPRHLWSGGATTNRRVVRHSIHIQAFAYPAIYGAEEQLPTAVSCGIAYTFRRSLTPPSMERRSNYQPPCRAAQHTHSGVRLTRHLWSGGATTNRRVVRHSIHIQAFAYPAIYGAEEQLPTAVSCGTAYTFRRSLTPPSMERRSNYQVLRRAHTPVRRATMG